MSRLWPSLFLSLLSLILAYELQADVDTYLEKIKPVLKARCYACHGALKQEADLRLDTANSIRQFTADGEALLQRVRSEDTDIRMPPIGASLTPEEIEAIQVWVSSGLPAPKGEVPEQSLDQHWAFQPPVLPDVSAPAKALDELIEQRHVALGIETTAGHASETELLRRVYLDLIGIPPTPAQIKAFTDGNIKYDAIVDELLASPLFGQRWGRHWMDIWRYSDWYGRRNVNDVRNSDPQIWRWRDWIVNSLNEDISYATMIQQMLAADELFPEDERAWPATGYLIRSYYSLNPNEWMRHNVEYTSKAFLGLTLNCAHCHDHKYDPIAHDDYFRLRAFFEPMGIRSDQAAGEARPPEFQPYTYGGSRTAVKVGMVRIIDEQPERPTYFYSGGDERNVDKQRGTVAPGVPQFLEHLLPPITPVTLPATSWYPGLRDSVRDYELDVATDRLQTGAKALDDLSEKPIADINELQSALTDAQVNYDKLVEQLKADGTTTALEGAKSLYLDAGTGRRVFHHDLDDLKQVKEGTTIEFELLILKDNHVNFQLAYDTRMHRTATYVAFENGQIRSYQPGGYTPLALGSYDHANGESRFHVKFLLHPKEDTADITVTIRNSRGEALRTLDTVTAALNGWDATKNKFQPITLDCRSNTTAIYDNIRIQTPGDQPLVLSFEDEQFKPGADADAIHGWRLALAEQNSQSSIIDILPTPELNQAALAVQKAREALLFADLPRTVAKMRVAANQAQLEAVQAVLATDQLRYLSSPDPETLAAAIKTTIGKQHNAKLLDAQWNQESARLAVRDARQLAMEDSEKQKQLDAATKALTAAEKSLADIQAIDVSKITDYEHLSSFAPKDSSGRRAALAKMIANRDNPLTARVAINHIWTRHFQTPLVSTPADFGRNGATPVFPEVLDYLAVKLMEANWSLKSVHKAIVLSDAYKRSSKSVRRQHAPELLTSFPHKRMEAEMVRDSILAIAGTLDTTPAANPLLNSEALKTFKRSMYYETFPEDGGSNALSKVFDSPSPTECFRRTTTIVPQQALVLTNSDFVHNAVAKLFEKITSNFEADTNDAFTENAFLHILGRKPTPEETQLADEFLNSESNQPLVRKALLRVLFNHNDFITIR